MSTDCHKVNTDLTPFEEYAGLEPWPLGAVRVTVMLLAPVGGLGTVLLVPAGTGWGLFGLLAGGAGLLIPVLISDQHHRARRRRLRAAWPHRNEERA